MDDLVRAGSSPVLGTKSEVIASDFDHQIPSPDGEIGRRAGFRDQCQQ